TMVMPPHDDPCGAYTVELFARAGMTEAMEVQRQAGRMIVLDPANPGAFASAEADARILYRSVGSRFPESVVVEIPPPDDMRHRIEFWAGAIARDGATQPGAAAFVDLLVSTEGQEILARHAFLPISEE